MKNRFMNVERAGICALILLVATVSFASPLGDGNKLYAAGNYAEALEKYKEAREKDPADPTLFYNIGTTHYRLGNYEEAIKELSPATRMPEKSLASKAAYNLANAYFRLGEKAETAQKIENWRQSIAFLKKAIEIDPDFENAKRNAEIVERRLKEALDEQKENNENNQNDKQEEMSEKAKEALARALQLCKETKYEAAKELLEKTIATEEGASQLNAYVQRIDDVIEIKNGRKPKAKIDASNASNDMEVI